MDAPAAPLSLERRLLAPWWHTLTILLVYLAPSIIALSRHGAAAQSGAASAPTHSLMIRSYLISIALEWVIAYWAWIGVHWRGGTLRDLTGGRWTSWLGVATDVAIALPFWVVWEFTAWLVHRIVDRMQTPTTPYQLPIGVLEVSLWILLSISAGVCEELVFRGYLQNQFRAATRSMAAAVILQGLIFGLAHTYQGWKQVIVIAALGILYGVLAAWRRNLRANMIAHAWSDIYEGWASFAFFGRV
ncbi:MAG TPA: type II CAAX endopeptidase family protein [Candidatus Acidoferrales bacterium]